MPRTAGEGRGGERELFAEPLGQLYRAATRKAAAAKAKAKAQAKSKRQRAKGKVEAARRKGFISMLRIEERKKKIPVSFAPLVDLLRRAIKYIHSRLIGLVLWGP